MKIQTATLIALPRHNIFKLQILHTENLLVCSLLQQIIKFYGFSIKTKDDLKDLEDLADVQSKVKQVRLAEILGRQGFHYDTKELFGPITTAVKVTSEKLLEET